MIQYNIFRMIMACTLLALLTACSGSGGGGNKMLGGRSLKLARYSTNKNEQYKKEEQEKKNEEDRKLRKKEAAMKWNYAQKRMKNDGYLDINSDKQYVSKKNVNNKEIKILNNSRDNRQQVKY